MPADLTRVRADPVRPARPTPAVVAVRARRLPAQAAARPAVPDWALPALRPAGAPWPEDRDRYVLELVASDGTKGAYGPCSRAVVDLVRDQLAPGLLGTPVGAYRAVGGRAAVVGRHRSGSHFQLARSAVELAFLDLAGRAAGTSVSRLLGGPVRASVPCYATALGVDVDHPLAADLARHLAGTGWWGQKWALPGFARGEEPRADRRRLERLRAAVGDDTRLMVDATGRWSVDYARRMVGPLADAGVSWVEEPLAAGAADPPRPDGVPLAAGEHAYAPADQYGLLATGRVDVWQPDVGWCGGLVQALRGADLAAELGVRVFPHGGCLAGSVVLAALTDPAVLPAVEFHLTQEPVRQQVQRVPVEVRGGRLDVPDGPGLTAGYVHPDPADPGPTVTLAEVPDAAV